jgi:hypothetical protein
MSVLNLWRNREVVATFSGSEMQIKHFNFNSTTIPLYTGDVLPAGSFPLPLNTNIFVSSNNGDYLNIEFVTEVKHSVPLPITLPVFDANGNTIMKYRLIWEMTGAYHVNGKINGKPISFTTNGFMEYVSGKSILPLHP